MQQCERIIEIYSVLCVKGPLSYILNSKDVAGFSRFPFATSGLKICVEVREKNVVPCILTLINVNDVRLKQLHDPKKVN